MVFIRTEYATSSARSEVGFKGKICAVLAMQVSPTLKRGNPREKLSLFRLFYTRKLHIRYFNIELSRTLLASYAHGLLDSNRVIVHGGKVMRVFITHSKFYLFLASTNS